MSNFTDLDQLFLEYVNRARLDPLREVDRLLADGGVTDSILRASLEDLGAAGLNRGLDPDTVSGLALQVLAPDAMLRDAALGHSEWMLDANIFSHTGQNGSTIAERIEAAGYSFAAPSGWGENLSWQGTHPIAIDMQAAVINHAAGLFDSNGHRRNILTEWFRETGIAQVEGVFTHSGTDWNASILTQKFALSGTDVFLTGVVYSDTDEDGFYSLGEGESGVSIAASGISTFSANAGGYALALGAAPDVAVTLTWGEISIGVQVDLSAGNVKLDLVAGSDDSLRLLSSGNLVLGAGADAAQLLGAADLSLQANDSGNLLLGNYGDNALTGGAGNDTLEGGAGNDTLDGGGGVNTARFSGTLADYGIYTDAGTGITTVTDLRGAGTALSPHDGVNTLHNIHFIEFADQVFELTPPGGTGGVTAMATAFTITGFGFSMAEGTDQVTDITGQATLGLSFTQAAPVINYTVNPGQTEGPFDIEFGGNEPILSTLNNGLIVGDPEVMIAQLEWSESGTPRTTDVLIMNFSMQEQYMFVVGGDPLPASMTPTTLSDIIADAISNGVDVPDSASPFAPDTPIALTGLAGWNAIDTSTLHTTTISGFSFTEADNLGNGYENAMPSTLSMTFAEGGASLIHEIVSVDDETGAARVRISFDELPIALRLNGELLGDADVDILATRFVSDGQTYDVLIIDDLGSDRQHLLQLAGSPLPDGTDTASVADFWDLFETAGPIPDGPAAPGTPILLSGIPGATTIVTDAVPAPDPVEGTGDPAIVQFDGYRIDEDEDNNLLGYQASQMTMALSEDDTVYSYTLPLGDGNDEGFDSVDITGPLPYAFLIDGVVPFNFPEIGFERITVDGINYDLMFVRLPGVDGSTYVFQIDGATPLPFTSFAAVEAFIEKADEDDAFGPIPAGSPFAPGTDFTFLNSSYATVDTSPQIIEGGNFVRGVGFAHYGSGAGTEASLTVVNGAELTLPANGAAGPFMSVGRNDGYGLITVAGPDSSMDLVAGGGNVEPNWGASVSIGRDGGTGGLRILDGGSFSITDPVGTSAGPDSDGEEWLSVGRISQGSDATSAYGYVDVIGGSFLHAGTGTIAAYGRGANSQGYLYVADGGTYRQQTTSDNDYTQLTFGRDGGFGRAIIDNGRVTVQAADNGDGAINIGINGSGGFGAPGGIVRIYSDHDGDMPVHGMMITGGANSNFVEATIGRSGGGLVELHGGYFGVLNRGVTYDDDLNQINLAGDGGQAEMRIGRDGGRGMIDAYEGSEVFVSGTDSARMAIGAGNGSLGEVFLNDSELNVYSWAGEAGIDVGAWDGGEGLLRLSGESEADIWGGNGAYLNVGRSEGNTGTLELEDSQIVVRSDTSFANMEVGVNGGTGTAQIDDSLIMIVGNEGNPYAGIGRFGGTGTVNITGQLTTDPDAMHGVLLTGGANSGFAGVDIGQGAGASGSVTVSSAMFGILNRGVHIDPETGDDIPLDSDGGGTTMRIGIDGGSGELLANNGAEVFLESGNSQAAFIVGGQDGVGTAVFDSASLALSGSGGTVFLGVGRNEGEGDLTLRNGASIDMQASGTAEVAGDVGARGGQGTMLIESGSTFNGGGLGQFYVGSQYPNNPSLDGANGTLTLTGAGSRMTGFRELFIGNNEAGIGITTGVVNVLDGASIQLGSPGIDASSSLFVGRFAGSHGTLNITDGFVSLQGANGTDSGGEAWQPYTAIGYYGGTGIVNIMGTVAGQEDDVGFVQIGGGESPVASIDIGRGENSNGTVTVSGGYFGTENRGQTYSTEPPFDPVDLPGDGGRAIIRVGVEGATGELTATNNALIFAEGGPMGAVVNVGDGGTGTFTLAGGRLMVEGADDVAFLGIGRAGGTGEMTMSDGATGRIELLSGTTGFSDAGIGVGFQGIGGGAAGNGTLILQGMMTELEVVSARFANLFVGGSENGAGNGLLRVEDGATLSYESVEHQQLNIGRAGGDGVLEVLNGGTFMARTTGAGFDSFMLVGTEGGTGDVRVDNASLSLVSEGGNAGIRVGTRWTHSDDNTGAGSFVLENGAGALINGANTTNFWVGGLEGGTGSAIIRSGADLTMYGGDNFAIIGGVFGMINAAGGTGTLEVTGAGSTLTGANTLLVGFNNGTGTLTMSDSAMVEVEGGGDDAFFGIGVHSSTTGNGGTGSAIIDGLGSVLAVRGTDAQAVVGSQSSTGTLTIANGAQFQVEAGVGGPVGDTGALLAIGSDGGSGQVTVQGQNTLLSVTHGNSGVDGGAIRVGATGLLHVSNGATVLANAVEIGGAMTTLGVLNLDDGTVATPGSTSVFENGWMGGNGTINGNLNISAGEFRVGDLYNAETGSFVQGEGLITVNGNAGFGAALAAFEFGTGSSNQLNVSGTLNFDGTAINVGYLGGTDLAQSAVATMLARADGGISLNDITLTSSIDGLDGADPALELRADGTELWFISDGELPPQTGQALTLTQLAQSGTTITYAISIDPALVSGGVLQDLDLTLDFNSELIAYVPDSISGGFTAVPGSLVISGSGLNIDTLGQPVVTFDMQLTSIAGARNVSFDLSGVSVNGIEMHDQTGEDAFGFAYDPAFYTLGGLVELRDVRPTPSSPEDTLVTFTEAGGTQHQTTLGADGMFSFLLQAGTEGDLSLVRDYNAAPDGPDKALGIQDVLSLFRMVVSVPGLAVDDTDIIAGDFDNSGEVNIQDVLALFRHVVGVPNARDAEFIFVDQDSVDQAGLTNASLGNVPARSDSFEIGPLAGDVDMSFLGILSGDLQNHL